MRKASWAQHDTSSQSFLGSTLPRHLRPRVCHKRLKRRRKGKMERREARTFENDRIFRSPDVPEGSSILTGLKVDATRLIGEHMYLRCIHKILHRVSSKVTSISLLTRREGLIKVGVLPEGYPFVTLATAEIPENFCQVRIISNHL